MQTGINPFSVLDSQQQNAKQEKSFDKVVDLLVRVSRMNYSHMLIPWNLLPFLPEALMDEQVYNLFKSTRVLLEPFRELTMKLATGLKSGCLSCSYLHKPATLQSQLSKRMQRFYMVCTIMCMI